MRISGPRQPIRPRSYHASTSTFDALSRGCGHFTHHLDPPMSGFSLERVDGVLQLVERDGGRGIALQLDDVRRRLRQGKRLALAKAIGVRPDLYVLDAMAGLGLDGLTLAALGCRVLMVERHPLLHGLLADAIERARIELRLDRSIELRAAEASDVIRGASANFDCIYLDPMFPERDKSALPRRSAQVLADLLGADDGELERLLPEAIARAVERVVVKRRRHDPIVAKPDWQIVGRSVRFDVYRGAASRCD